LARDEADVARPTGTLVEAACAISSGLFGTAHNSFMSCCELFFLSNTYFQNSFMGEAVFLLLLQKHKLDEAEKNSLL